ncbi:MAG TPA: hypothetical protein VGG75_21425 [Trebonia sp.]
MDDDPAGLVPASRTVTAAHVASASSGTSASTAATALDGHDASTVADTVTVSADQQPSTSGGSSRGTSGSPLSSRATVSKTS